MKDETASLVHTVFLFCQSLLPTFFCFFHFEVTQKTSVTDPNDVTFSTDFYGSDANVRKKSRLPARVTRLAEFSTFGWLFTSGSFFDNKK
jgi:hypothetical protein